MKDQAIDPADYRHHICPIEPAETTLLTRANGLAYKPVIDGEGAAGERHRSLRSLALLPDHHG